MGNMLDLYIYTVQLLDIKTFPALLYIALSFREKCLKPWFYEEKEKPKY